MSEEKSIYKALVAAQKKIGSANKGAENPFYNSTYADLGEVIKTVKEACNEEGLSIIQPLRVQADLDGKPYQVLETTIIYGETGEAITSSVMVPEEKNIQKFGGLITYLRRYALQSLLLVPAIDDDANCLVKAPTKAPVKRKATTKF